MRSSAAFFEDLIKLYIRATRRVRSNRRLRESVLRVLAAVNAALAPLTIAILILYAGAIAEVIDELIRDLLNDSDVSSESSTRGMATTAALFETAFGSTKWASRISMLDRLLVAQAFAAELAEALAPALAEQLAPRLLKALEQFMTTEAATKKPTSATRSGSQTRKSDTKLPGATARSEGPGGSVEDSIRQACVAPLRVPVDQ